VPRLRRLVSAGLTGLAGTACLACCAIPLLLAAGVLGGAGWVIAGQWMPGVAVSLVALATLAWWRTARRRGHRGDCASSGNCACRPDLSPPTGS
jgi:mercuric ion transport protein